MLHCVPITTTSSTPAVACNCSTVFMNRAEETFHFRISEGRKNRDFLSNAPRKPWIHGTGLVAFDCAYIQYRVRVYRERGSEFCFRPFWQPLTLISDPTEFWCILKSWFFFTKNWSFLLENAAAAGPNAESLLSWPGGRSNNQPMRSRQKKLGVACSNIFLCISGVQ